MRAILTALLLSFITLFFLAFIFTLAIVPAKEGLGSEYIIYYIVLALICITILVAWYRYIRKNTHLVIRLLGILCIVVTVLDLVIVSLLLGSILKRSIRSQYASKNVKIISYSENFIHWPGFDFPVGLNINIKLEGPYLNDATCSYTPLIWMGPIYKEDLNGQETYDLYFSSKASIEVEKHLLAILKKPLYTTETSSTSSQKYNQIQLTSNLYPGVVADFENQNAFCTYPAKDNSKDFYLFSQPPDLFSMGQQLNALWFCTGGLDVVLNKPLTQVMRQHSKLQNNPQLWNSMQQQFTDEELLKIGYKLCSLSHRTHCFCR